MKFSHKIVSASSALLLSAIGLLSFSQYVTIGEEVQSQISESVTDALQGVSRTVHTEMHEHEALARYVTSLAEKNIDHSAITDVIQNKSLHDTFLLVGGGLDTDGKPIAGVANWNPGENWDARKRPWYIDAKNQNTLIVTDPYEDSATKEMLISIATPLNEQGQFKGALFFDMSLKGLSDLVNEVRLDSGYLFIVTSDSVVLAHPDRALNGKFMGEFLPSISIQTGVEQVAELNTGESRVITFEKVKGYDWYIGAVIDGEMAFSSVTTLRNKAIIFSLIAVIIATALLSFFISKLMAPLDKLNTGMGNVASGHGDLTQRLDTDVDDEFATLSNSFNQFTGSLQEKVKHLKMLATDIHQGADHVSQGASATADAMAMQLSELEQLATAMHQMSTTSGDVAGNAQEAASAADQAETAAQTGADLVSETRVNIVALSEKISQAGIEVKELEASTDNIDKVLQVINDIAEQTNLLALNAAIEAARAGEHGRGFSVVADEVRSLASRTQDSTTEIKSIIEQLQSRSRAVVKVMDESQASSTSTVENAQKLEHTLHGIYEKIQHINLMNLQISSAAEEQSLVAEEINTNTLKIKELSEKVSSDAQKSNQATERQVESVRQQNEVLETFTV
ncbi:methyl-accepting chemotaxis protein [Photobacterium atrarenae]|uniref:Methyl-accepting chemotaxis protein n=1 Tax=Photobacterium atrarenae TaxID=865757 RepID=A0ABY5GH49_9GAMM|nr:methyl-accepting chemotaxis protein [Photobacterium atrarenae]UTV28595.1 methyl-accepting chemotaxis protein [Photobacterium atrarenae]